MKICQIINQEDQTGEKAEKEITKASGFASSKRVMLCLWLINSS